MKKEYLIKTDFFKSIGTVIKNAIICLFFALVTVFFISMSDSLEDHLVLIFLAVLILFLLVNIYICLFRNKLKIQLYNNGDIIIYRRENEIYEENISNADILFVIKRKKIYFLFPVYSEILMKVRNIESEKTKNFEISNFLENDVIELYKNLEKVKNELNIKQNKLILELENKIVKF